MRGVHSAVDEIRRNVFTEVARLAYESGDLNRVDMIPYTIVPGEVARHRHDVFLERAIVQERVRLALGMSLQPAGEQTPVSANIQEAASADDKYFEEPLVNIISFACNACAWAFTSSEAILCISCALQSCSKASLLRTYRL